jgi:AcrR family transcriptional regulator/transposase-like protein
LSRTPARQDYGNGIWDESACLEWLWRARYVDDEGTAACPRCLRRRRFHRVRSRRCYGCDSCGFQIHPAAGTIFERSRTPLQTWFRAVAAFVEGDGTVSAKRLARDLSVTYKTAWRMARLIRERLDSAGERDQILDALAEELRQRAARGEQVDPNDASQLERSSTPDGRVEEILSAACRAIVRRGFASTRIADIAEEAGMSTGIIHYYFNTKDDVLLAALNWAGEQLYCRLDELLDPDSDDVERLAKVIQLALPHEGVLRDEYLLWVELWTRVRHRPELVKECDVLSERWHRLVSDVIKRGAEHGRFKPIADVDELAERLIALVDGFGFKAAIGYDRMRIARVRQLLLSFTAEQLQLDYTDLDRLALASDVPSRAKTDAW